VTRLLEELADDPYPALHALRRAAPIAAARSGGAPMWLVTRRDDVLRVLRDPETFSTDHPASPIRATFGPQMLSAEGEAQRRYKSACAGPFNRRAVDTDAAAIVQRRVAQYVTAVPNEPFDVRTRVAGPLALAVVADVIGIPDAMHEHVRVWYDAFAASLATHDAASPARRAGRNSAEAFRAAVRPLLDQGTASLLAHLVRQTGADRLRDEEILSNALIVLFGGIETTEAAMLNALWAILTHGAVRDAVSASDAVLSAAIEESLRWEPAVQTCTRYATQRVTLRDVVIGEGEIVQCMIGAANRDPDHFVDPDRFDAGRANAADHVSFGAGRHYCLGAVLARLEVRVLIRALLERWPALGLMPGRDGAPRGHEFRKPAALWVVPD
jgi:cytochrome P450